jgi:hypothetical protein
VPWCPSGPAPEGSTAPPARGGEAAQAATGSASGGVRLGRVHDLIVGLVGTGGVEAHDLGLGLERLRGGLGGVVLLAPAREHLHAVGHDLGAVVLDLVVVLPAARLEAPLERDHLALAQVLATDLGEAVSSVGIHRVVLTAGDA